MLLLIAFGGLLAQDTMGWFAVAVVLLVVAIFVHNLVPHSIDALCTMHSNARRILSQAEEERRDVGRKKRRAHCRRHQAGNG